VPRQRLFRSFGTRRGALFKGQTPKEQEDDEDLKSEHKNFALEQARKKLNIASNWGSRTIEDAADLKVSKVKVLEGEALKKFAEETIDGLAQGLEDYKKESNSHITVSVHKGSRYSVSLEFDDKENAFHIAIEMDPPKPELEFTSPVSGTRTYIPDAEPRRWVEAHDGHDFKGLAIRDLMRLCYGVPSFKF